MTTSVIVRTDHGWPVLVTPKDPKTGAVMEHLVVKVESGTERIFYIHDGMDIHVHEVQPNEIAP